MEVFYRKAFLKDLKKLKNRSAYDRVFQYNALLGIETDDIGPENTRWGRHYTYRINMIAWPSPTVISSYAPPQCIAYYWAPFVIMGD